MSVENVRFRAMEFTRNYIKRKGCLYRLVPEPFSIADNLPPHSGRGQASVTRNMEEEVLVR